MGDENMPEQVLEARSSSEQHEQEPASPPSCLTRAIADPDDGTAVEISWSTGVKPHQITTHQGRKWMTLTWTQPLETLLHAMTQMMCLYEWPAIGTGRGYRLPVDWAKAVSGKGSVRIARTCGDTTINVLEQSVNTLLGEHCNSFEMQKMTIRPDQLLPIAEATGSKIHTRESEAETHSRAKNLVFSLKQYHAHYYWFYEKGTTKAMVCLQGLHTSDAFWCSNKSASVGLRSFFPWCFSLRGSTETIATHLREVHYRSAITCNICKAFASMLVQIILQHCAGCKAKSHKKKSKAKDEERAS